MAKLNPFDLYDVASLLSEEELMIKESVARFVDERAMPVIAEHFDNATFPGELVPEIAEMGLLGSSLEGYGCAGLSYTWREIEDVSWADLLNVRPAGSSGPGAVLSQSSVSR